MSVLFVHSIRKDGKYKVTYSYSNGVHLHKIRTVEQIEADRTNGYEIMGYYRPSHSKFYTEPESKAVTRG